MSRAAASTSSGLGRALVAVYGVFALAATARSLVQLATKAGEAPLAYALSAVAALVYVAATLGLAEVGPNPRRLAWAAVGFELVGVLTVGTLTVLDPELFPDATVWSDYGAGYGWLPLVLPFVGHRVALAHAGARLRKRRSPSPRIGRGVPACVGWARDRQRPVDHHGRPDALDAADHGPHLETAGAARACTSAGATARCRCAGRRGPRS